MNSLYCERCKKPLITVRNPAATHYIPNSSLCPECTEGDTSKVLTGDDGVFNNQQVMARIKALEAKVAKLENSHAEF